MTSRERLLTAWSFQEPDRVPIEMALYAPARDLPGADELAEFAQNEADNFHGVAGFDWGFFGLDNEYSEEVLEDIPGRFKRLRRTYSTAVGDFAAVTRHNADELDPGDFYWEQRYVETLDDFRRLAEAPRSVRPFDLEAYNAGCAEVGDRGLPMTAVHHALGMLVRSSNMVEVYGWMVAEEDLMLKFLESTCTQAVESVLSLAGQPLAEPSIFVTWALEMLIPPWLGRYHFDKLVFPFDSEINAAIHKIGGRHRAHCHGQCGGYLERFVEMGLDSVEPLEPAPYGDTVLAEAKRQVGDRMLLSGNIPSQQFALDSFRVEDVRPMVRQALAEGAPGGGFTLRTSGGAVGLGKTEAQAAKEVQCGLAMIEAWRDYGGY